MKRILLLTLIALALGAQTARFPSAIATDKELTDMNDRAQSTLSTSLTSGALTLNVVSGSRFAANQIVTVGSEQIKLCQVIGNTLTVGHASCPNADGRGFAGTSAASHSTGTQVSNFIVAYNFKALREEIKAIETSLGANLENAVPVPQQTYDPRTYDFAPQTPGGSISVGANTVNMNPCPRGLKKTGFSASVFYLSGGTGTAEPVRATGGDCPEGGGGTGTIIFNAVNTHTGAWTIRSATSGLDLACSSNQYGAHVMFFPGHYNIYGTIRPSEGCTIDGQGRPSDFGPSGSATLHMQTNGIPMIDNSNHGISIKNIQLSFGTYPAYTVNGSVATAGSVGIQHGITTPDAGKRGDRIAIENVHVHNFYDNIVAIGEAYSTEVYIRKVYSLEAKRDGLRIGKLGAGFAEDVLAIANTRNGYTFVGPSAAMQSSGLHCFANGGWGMYIEDAHAFHVTGVDCEANTLGGIHVGNVPLGIFSEIAIQNNGEDPFGTPLNATAPGMEIAAGQSIVLLSDFQIGVNQGTGLKIAGTFVRATNGHLIINGRGETAGQRYCFEATGQFLLMSNVQCYGDTAKISGSNNQIINSNFIGPTTEGTPSVIFTATAVANIFSNNQITNPLGVAMQIDAGASLMRATNSIAGTITGTSLMTAGSVNTVALEILPNPTALTITSNTITITSSFHTLGAGLVTHIDPPNTAYSICSDILATAAFTTDQSFNIASPPITASVGRLYRACYNASTHYWSMTQ